MKWLVSADTGWLSKDGQVALARRVFLALRGKHPEAMRRAYDLVRKHERVELNTRELVTAVCQCLQDDGVHYEIHKLERVDVDDFRYEVGRLAPA